MAYTIDHHYNTEIKIKNSKFISDLFIAGTTNDAMEHLQVIRELHPKANHHCFAYKIGCPVRSHRYSDDREPSGTAGKSIYGQLESFDVTNIICIVNRYFGGTLLGTGGLIRAYRDAAKEVLSQAALIEINPEYRYKVTFGFERMPMIMEAAKKFPGEIVEKSLFESPYLVLSTENMDSKYLIALFKSYVLGIELDYAASLDNLDFKIEKLDWDV